ncbi:hypothetical protein FHS04_001257 [Mesoflavibacter sabulilitoris]|uniref:Uncharacterized protein n=2 Tax=Mesoflavibacter TaxID=444051 RepID=A0A2T1NAF6_9FLAO|nr:hypothetical protein [Mesoflavibacter zeaxanthinifaciens]MBB3123754.1 hypothetical protein [Mesoflavibacter zeaxanthinifaciens subsp. sabulilitoris]PSG89127.1 hypothetical protein C7H61_09215 [Mesoflavibacter zeaxanthinifaciens subsp. sabulilitoris]
MCRHTLTVRGNRAKKEKYLKITSMLLIRKKTRLKLGYKLTAIIEILYADRFELIVKNKDGSGSNTKYCSDDIDINYK